jgi:hypothetical protein
MMQDVNIEASVLDKTYKEDQPNYSAFDMSQMVKQEVCDDTMVHCIRRNFLDSSDSEKREKPKTSKKRKSKRSRSRNNHKHKNKKKRSRSHDRRHRSKSSSYHRGRNLSRSNDRRRECRRRSVDDMSRSLSSESENSRNRTIQTIKSETDNARSRRCKKRYGEYSNIENYKGGYTTEPSHNSHIKSEYYGDGDSYSHIRNLRYQSVHIIIYDIPLKFRKMRRSFIAVPDDQKDPLDAFMQNLFPKAIVNPCIDVLESEKKLIYFVTDSMININDMFHEFQNSTLNFQKWKFTLTKEEERRTPRIKLSYELVPQVYEEVIDLEKEI